MEHKEHRTGFRLFNRFSRNKAAVSTAATVTGGSAVVSAVSQSNNSAAASRNLNAASVKLQDYLETLDNNDSMPHDVVSMSRWIEKTAKFSNSSYGDGSLLNEAAIPSSHRILIELAGISSKLVYGVPGSSLRLKNPNKFLSSGPSHDLPPDALIGTLKATSIRVFNLDLRRDGDITPVVVIAIRGTVSIRDWSVNFNHSSTSSQMQTTNFMGQADGNRAYTVHTGFLESAHETISPLKNALESVLSDPVIQRSSKPPQLLLTGHSAGGAVASLLYAHLSHTTADYNAPNQRTLSALQSIAPRFSSVHLVTFGAPPVTNPPILPRSKSPVPGTRVSQGSGAASTDAFYAVVNEGDPIPRVDEKYIDALLRVYVSPVSVIPTVPSLSSQLDGLSLNQSEVGPRCDLPKLQLKNAGRLLLVRKIENRYLDDTVFYDIPAEGSEGALEGMLFGNPAMHHMEKYLERLKLVKGKQVPG